MMPNIGRRLFTLSLVFAVLVVFSANAQDKLFATKGVVEIAGSVSFASFTPVADGETGDATTLFSFGPQIAFFPFDRFAIGFSPGIALLPGLSIVTPSEGDNTTVTQLFVYPGYNYLLPSGSLALFAEVPLGYTSMSSGDNTADGFSWGVKGGAKVVAAGNVLITIFGQYLSVTMDPEGATGGRNGINYLSFGVGVGGFF